MECNRTRKFFYNSVSTAMLQVVNMIIGFILPRVMLKCYGSEVNGLVTSITQFISYFNVVEAGLASAAVYSLYKPLMEKDNKKISEVVSTAKKFYFFSGYIFVFLVLGLAVVYPFLINTDILSNVEIFILVIILGSGGFLDFFTLSKYRVLLTADQKIYVISISSIIYYVLNTAVIVVLANFGINIVIVRSLAALSIISRSLILYFYTKKHYNKIRFNEKANNKILDKRMDALYLQILGSVQTGAPVVILTIFSKVSNLIAVSIYSVYNIVMQGINNLLAIFTSGLSSSFGEIIVSGNQRKLQDVSQEFDYIYYNLITIVYSVSFVMIMPFIKLYCSDITDANYYIPIVGFLFVLNGLVYNLKTPQGMLVISAGMYKETRIQSTIQGLIIIILGVFLVPRFGIVGILAANIASNLYRDIDLMFFIPSKLTKLPVYNLFKRYLKLILLLIIIVLVCNVIPGSIDSYADFILYGFVYCIIAVFIIIIFDLIFERDYLKKIIQRLKMIVGIKNEKNNK